jgi:hypothetical protein
MTSVDLWKGIMWTIDLSHSSDVHAENKSFFNFNLYDYVKKVCRNN